MRYNKKKIEYTLDENGCHICISHCKNNKGYPLARRNGKLQLISHIIYERKYGPIPDGLILRHICDTPACINPEHLLTGTQADNMKDMCKRKRQATGKRNNRTKLTEEQVLEIRLDTMFTNVELSKKYDTCQSNISAIKNKKRWKYLY